MTRTTQRASALCLLVSACSALSACNGQSRAKDDRAEAHAAVAAQAALQTQVCVSIQRGKPLGNVEDTQIANNAASTNYGADTVLTTGGLLVAKMLLRFDLSQIPQGVTIVSGFLALIQADFGSAPVTAHNVLAPWSEGAVTWSSFAGASSPTPFATAVFGTGPLPPVRFDMKAQLDAWINGGVPNYGIVLEQGLSGMRSFKSSEDPTRAARPRIELCYTSADLCAGVTCAPSDPCHAAATCDPTTGQCGASPAKQDGTPCDDGNACTAGDACQAGVCVAGAQVNCDDGNTCTTDACNPATGCTHVAASCDDGVACTVDTCASPSGCQHVVACPPGGPCSNTFCGSPLGQTPEYAWLCQ